jgi:hypothetical protein
MLVLLAEGGYPLHLGRDGCPPHAVVIRKVSETTPKVLRVSPREERQ